MPVTRTGEKVGELKGKTFKVEIYQVATDKSAKDSMLVDVEKKESLLKVGDPIVYFNFVVTNTGTETVPLSVSTVMIDLDFADWKYMSGLPSDSSSAQYEKHGLTDRAKKLQAKEPLQFAPGESFNIAENITYTPGKEVEVETKMIPLTADGELDLDKKESVKGTFKMK